MLFDPVISVDSLGDPHRPTMAVSRHGRRRSLVRTRLQVSRVPVVHRERMVQDLQTHCTVERERL